MNAISVRSQTKFAAALVAAGVVSAASIVGVPQHDGIPALNVDVANASVITDALYNLGDAVNGVASGAAYGFDGAFSLPFDATTAIAIAIQNPSLSPNLLSWLVQRYVNPADSYPYFTYPWAIKVYSIEPLASLLPYPLGPGVDSGLIINAANQIADAINAALSVLPDSAPGVAATDAFWATDIGRTVVAANSAVTAPVWMLYSTAYYLGYLPADLEATFESALQNPADIPGLVSNLVYGLLSPTSGLLGDLIYYATLPLTSLPGPIGELATNVVTAASNGIDSVLALLPTPISPTPFPSANVLAAQSVDTSVTSVPEASLGLTGAITLESTDLAARKLDTASTPVVSPADSSGGTETDVSAAIAASGEASEGASDVVTNRITKGNKVTPGDTFASQTKVDSTKNDVVAVVGSAGDSGATVDTTEATDPQDGPTPEAGAVGDAGESESGAAA